MPQAVAAACICPLARACIVSLRWLRCRRGHKAIERNPCMAAQHTNDEHRMLATMKAHRICLLSAALLLGCGYAAANSETIGSVDTVFKWIGPDHKIVVDAYDDPKVAGVTCYVSRAKTGGVKGALGLAEDRSEASISCQATGPISFAAPIKQQEEVFTERTSLLFKRLRVVRMVDSSRNALVYMTYSDRVIEGSPQNSVAAVPVPHSTPIPVK